MVNKTEHKNSSLLVNICFTDRPNLRKARFCSQRETESKLLYDWRFTANQFVLASSPLRLTARFFFSQLNTCGHSPYVTSLCYDRRPVGRLSCWQATIWVLRPIFLLFLQYKTYFIVNRADGQLFWLLRIK
jgi:hypothetical protein